MNKQVIRILYKNLNITISYDYDYDYDYISMKPAAFRCFLFIYFFHIAFRLSLVHDLDQ